MIIEIESKENHSSVELFNILQRKLGNYQEDDNYYNSIDIKNWYYDWDFKEFNPNIYSHGFHQYPAKFIPQLARKILRVFTNQNSVVLDNFSGSGTTLIEGMLLNRLKMIGIELNPFACFIAKVKTTPINPTKLLKSLEKIESSFSSRENNINIPSFNNIDFWFREDIIKDLAKLRTIIDEISDFRIKNFFLLVFSELVRRCSFTNHSGFKLHRDKSKLNDSFNPKIHDDFKKISYRNISLMHDFYQKTKQCDTSIEIIAGDSTKKQNIPAKSIDFMLASPPYGDSKTTVAYGQFSRLSWQWITNDDSIYNLDSYLLGGQNNVDLDSDIINNSSTLRTQLNQIMNIDLKRSKDVLSFYIDLYKTLQNAYYYLKKGKYYVIVTGNRTVKNVQLRTDLITSELAKEIGFKTEKILYRNIINKRMPNKNSPTNKKGVLCSTMLTENIIFLKKI